MAHRATPPGLAGLKRRLGEWLSANCMSASELGRQVGLSDQTIRRLVGEPAYRSTGDTWRLVAQRCGWAESEVLAAAGFQAATTPRARGWERVVEGLNDLGVPHAKQQALRTWLDLDSPQPLQSRSAVPSTDGS